MHEICKLYLEIQHKDVMVGSSPSVFLSKAQLWRKLFHNSSALGRQLKHAIIGIMTFMLAADFYCLKYAT